MSLVILLPLLASLSLCLGVLAHGIARARKNEHNPFEEPVDDVRLPAVARELGATPGAHKPCPCGDNDGLKCSLPYCPYPGR